MNGHDTRHFQCRCTVPFLDLAAKNRRPCHHGILHAGKADVRTVDGFAGRDVVMVMGLDLALAHIIEFVRALETKRINGRNGKCHCCFCEFAKAKGFALFFAGRIEKDHLVVLGTAKCCIHTPLGSRCRFQHLAHRGTALAHGLDEVAHTARAVGVLVTVLRFVAVGCNDLHLRPVGFHFVRHDHGQTCRDACAHFGTMRHDRDRAVLVDGYEHFRIVDGLVRHSVAAGGVGFDNFACGCRRKINCKNKSRRREQAAQHAAAADVLN